MKNNKASLSFTLFIIRFLMVVFVGLLFSFWKLAEIYCVNGYASAFDYFEKLKALIVVFYLCSPLAAVVLFQTERFLVRIKNKEVFTEKNVKALRILSYMCFLAVPFSIPLCFFFAGAFPIPASAGVLGLILRVLKNIFAEGCEIKSENDLTV